MDTSHALNKEKAKGQPSSSGLLDEDYDEGLACLACLPAWLWREWRRSE